MLLHSNIQCTVLFLVCTCAANGLKLESILLWWSVHVSSQPGEEAQRTGVSTQPAVPHSDVFMSHCHGRVEEWCVFVCCDSVDNISSYV